MLSRFGSAVRCPSIARFLPLRGCSAVSAAKADDTVKIQRIDEGPERDLVNFPRLVRIDQTPVRMMCVPEEWIHAMYDKSGVCGPYMLAYGGFLLLLSKEYIVNDHNLSQLGCLAVICTLGVHYLGPPANKLIEKLRSEEEADVKNYEHGRVTVLEDAIDSEKEAQATAKGQAVLFEAKRENVAMQLETEFRRRQMVVYNKVKNHLDCQVQQLSVARSFQQKNLVDWVVRAVQQGLGSQLDQAIMQQCFTDLKVLAKSV